MFHWPRILLDLALPLALEYLNSRGRDWNEIKKEYGAFGASWEKYLGEVFLLTVNLEEGRERRVENLSPPFHPPK